VEPPQLELDGLCAAQKAVSKRFSPGRDKSSENMEQNVQQSANDKRNNIWTSGQRNLKGEERQSKIQVELEKKAAGSFKFEIVSEAVNDGKIFENVSSCWKLKRLQTRMRGANCNKSTRITEAATRRG
jgi:hypothetical protein